MRTNGDFAFNFGLVDRLERIPFASAKVGKLDIFGSESNMNVQSSFFGDFHEN
jgi:hypothetical protein